MKRTKGFKVEEDLIQRYDRLKPLFGIYSEELMFTKLVELAEEKLKGQVSQAHAQVVEAKEEASHSPSEPKTFDYENWHCDCPEGTYLKDKKEVHCRTRIKSILTWLPKNRLVNPQVCNNCFTEVRYGTFAGFQNWLGNIQKKQKTEKSTEWICVRSLSKNPNPEMQQAKCNVCKAKHWNEWKTCQELRQERGVLNQ